MTMFPHDHSLDEGRVKIQLLQPRSLPLTNLCRSAGQQFRRVLEQLDIVRIS